MALLSNQLTVLAADIYRSEAVMPGIQLFLAALIFYSFGLFVNNLLKIQCKTVIFNLLTGKLALFFYFYLRSGVSSIAGFGFSIYELYAMLALILTYLYHQNYRSDLKIRISPATILQLVAILSVCWLVAHRELPRESALSSDPDLHIFWADMLLKSGKIPDHLGLWGENGLNYPAGFSTINALWSYSSFLNPLQIVSIQPVLQTCLAFLLISACACRLVKSDNNLILPAIQIFSVAIYFRILPYSYQTNFFHLEGTARTSSLFMLAGMSLFFAAILPGFICKKYISDKYNCLLISCLCAICLIAIAPIHALYAAPCLTIILLYFLIFSRKYFFLCCAISAFIFLDPYYAGSSINKAPVNQSNEISIIKSVIGGLDSSLSNPFSSLSAATKSYFSLDFFRTDEFQKFFCLCCLLLLISRIFSKRTYSADLAFICFNLIVIVCLSFIIVPGFSPLADSAAYRLIPPYSLHHSQQLIFLGLVFLLCLLAAEVCSKLKTYLYLPALGILFLSLDHTKPQFINVRHDARYKISSGLGKPTANDYLLIEEIEIFSKSVIQKYNDLNYKTVPKILILNIPSDLSWEQWLFPYGASRILHLSDTLPLAFYYNQGQSIFSYQNYRQNICNNFNLQWLKENNIRYLFLPEEMGPVCIRGLSKIKESSKLLFSRGNSGFYELF